MLYIFNTTIAPTSNLTYHVKTITAEHARRILAAAYEQTLREGSCFGHYISAVGHDATAQIATEVLGCPVKVNRIAATMTDGDQAICVKLRGRAPEGVILTTEQMEEIGYDLVLMTAVDQSAVTDQIHRRIDPECDNMRPDAPPLEVCAAAMVDRFDRAVSGLREAYVEAGLSYSGNDAYGPVQAHMSRLCIAAVRKEVARITSVEGLDADGNGVVKDLSVKRKVRQALLDALNADIAADDMQAQQDRIEAHLFPTEEPGRPLYPIPSRRE